VAGDRQHWKNYSGHRGGSGRSQPFMQVRV